MKHSGGRSSKNKTLLGTSHIRNFLLAEMTERGLRVRDVASRMDGDALRNRVLLWHLIHHPTGVLGLGPAIANRLGQALGLSGELFTDMERAWERRA